MTITFLTGHSVARYVRSLAPLTPHSCLAALRLVTLALFDRSMHGIAHSISSLPCWTLEFHEYVFMLLLRSLGMNAIVVVTRNTCGPFKTRPSYRNRPLVQSSDHSLACPSIHWWRLTHTHTHTRFGVAPSVIPYEL